MAYLKNVFYVSHYVTKLCLPVGISAQQMQRDASQFFCFITSWGSSYTPHPTPCHFNQPKKISENVNEHSYNNKTNILLCFVFINKFVFPLKCSHSHRFSWGWRRDRGKEDRGHNEFYTHLKISSSK